MKNFIKLLLDPNGSVSFGRFLSFILAAFCLGWDTNYAVHFHAIPPAIDLAGQIGFFSAPYGITKYGEVKSNG